MTFIVTIKFNGSSVALKENMGMFLIFFLIADNKYYVYYKKYIITLENFYLQWKKSIF